MKIRALLTVISVAATLPMFSFTICFLPANLKLPKSLRNVLAVQDTAVQSNSVFGSQYGRFDSILRDQGEGSGSNQFGSSDDEDYDTDYSNRVDSGGYLPDNQGNNGHEDTSHYVWQKPAAGTNDPVLPLYPDVVPDDQKNRIGTSWKEFNRLQQPPDNGKGGGVPLANPAHNNILSQLDDYDVNANNDEYDYYTQYDNYNEISNDPLNIVGSEGQQPSIKHPSNPNSVNDHRDSSDGFGRVITGTGAGDQGPFGQERGSLANEYRPQQPNNNDNLPHDPAYDDNYDYEEGSDDFDSTDWFITVEGSSFNSLDPDSEVNVFPTPSTPVPTLATAVTTVTAWPAFPTLPKIVDVQPPLDPNSFGENSFVLPDKHTFEEVNPAGIPIDYNNYIDDTYDANNPDTYDDIEMYGGLSHVDQESSGNDNILDPDAEDRTDYKAIDNEDAIGHAMLTTTSSMVQTTVPLTTRTPSTSTSTLTFTTFTPASQPTSSKSSVSLTTLTTREGSANTTTSGIASPTKPPSKTDEKFVPKRKNPYVDPFIKPGILAALIGGAIVGLLAAILLVMFLVYRIRKKDEGSYALDEPKGPPYPYQYQKAPPREFYA